MARMDGDLLADQGEEIYKALDRALNASPEEIGEMGKTAIR